jgi:hypothetical protein
MDPGRSDLVNCIDDFGNTYSYSRKKYLEESGLNAARKKRAKWNLTVNEDLQAIVSKLEGSV